MRDPIELEVFKNLYHSIAEEMGAALRRTSFSPNIKERRDYSCAVFDSRGQVIAMGDHMPVHLGSMPMSVAAAISQFEAGPHKSARLAPAHPQLEPGDVVMLNDPFRGGTHLPDITLVMPVYISQQKWSDGRPARPDKLPRPSSGRALSAPSFYVASRAHHADVGGTYPGSMGPCREIYQEGFRIPPVKVMRAGKIVPDVLALLLNNVRTPEEREGDLGAQIAACQTGAARLAELCARYGLARAQQAAAGLLDYSEELMRALIATIPPGEYHAEDFLDDDGGEAKPIRIAVTIRVQPATTKSSVETRLAASHRKQDAQLSSIRRSASSQAGRRTAKDEGRTTNDQRPTTHLTIDFTGSDPQVAGAVNAVEAITYSACFYVFRCLLRDDVPATAGLMRPIRLIAPLGTVVNATPPAAVAGGNVETSQRIVDVLLRALAEAIPDRIPAAAAGTMNNLTIGGIDLRTPQPFAYYETIAGGMGARPTKDGVSGVHTHMTNSLNTPAEALENAYPVRLRRYSLRPNSGGRGLHNGGDGIIREIEVLTDAQVTLLADRRTRGPYGLAGGSDGAPGRTIIIRNVTGSACSENTTWRDGRPRPSEPMLEHVSRMAPGKAGDKEGFGEPGLWKGTASQGPQSARFWRSGVEGVPLRPAMDAALAAEEEELLPGKTSVRLRPGDRIRIESPGGGGWGKPNR